MCINTFLRLAAKVCLIFCDIYVVRWLWVCECVSQREAVRVGMCGIVCMLVPCICTNISNGAMFVLCIHVANVLLMCC